MKTQRLYSLITFAVLIIFSLLTINPALADDTDIYINNDTSGTASAPMVMFTLDWQPNLASTICNFPIGSSDATIASDCGGSANGWTATFVSNFTSSDLSDGTIDFFELLRAVLKEVVTPLDGVKVGLMMSHNQTCNPGVSGPSAMTSECSNGAYILSGFKYFEAGDANGNKQAFDTLLANIPTPQGVSSHPFQGKELYFELFRYLTGQEVYNGHLGWNDFGNTVPDANLNGQNLLGQPNLQSPDNSDIAWDITGTENYTLDASGNPVDVLDSANNPTYVSPLTSTMTCAKIFAVNIMFQTSTHEDDSDSAISASKASGGMNGLVLSGNTSGFPTVINWMYKNDLADGTYGTAPNISGTQNVTSFFITNKVDTTTNGYATAGGTGNALLLSTNPETLAQTLENIFNQVLSVSTTFVSASVPVNVFNRADYLNDVYLALFQAEATPRWYGNLKKLELKYDSNTGTYYISDVNGNPAFAADGRLNYSALTYWTDPTGYDVTNVTSSDLSQGAISGYDGRRIDSGGAGEQIPGYLAGLDEASKSYTSDAEGLSNGSGTRQVYTEPTSSYTPGTATALVPLNADPSTNSQLVTNLWPYLNATGDNSSASTGTATPDFTPWDTTTVAPNNPSNTDITEVDDILTWARGIDILDEDQDGNIDDSRDWLMADPIHSTPLTINYGADSTGYTTTNPDVRIITTGNDGFVHMFQNTDSSGAESGKEDWAFIPHASLGLLDRLMRNGTGSPMHPYGVDGTPVAYIDDINGDGTIDGNDKVYLYFGMRRGGRAYYALDITNPDNPQMLWSISNNTTGFSNLGLTFSTPTVATISYVSGSGVLMKNQPVLVFGGGYDVNKDLRSSSIGGNDTMGNAVYIVDAKTGTLIWKAVYGGTTREVSETEYDNQYLTDSIPAPVTVLDSNGDGNIDRAYVGDTGGQIWRLDLAGTDRTKWTIRRLANIGVHDSSNSPSHPKLNDRRFFHAVDVVQTVNSAFDCSNTTSSQSWTCDDTAEVSQPYDAVIAGTGDRANPLDEGIGNYIPQNWFYMFKDYDTVSGTTGKNPDYPYTQADMWDTSSDCIQTQSCTSPAVQDLTNGWKFALAQEVGEKDLSRPITVNGVIYFTTYLPPLSNTTSGSCTPTEGTGSVYAVDLEDSGAAYNWDLTNTTTNGTGQTFDMGATDRSQSSGVGIPANVIAIRKGGSLQILTPGSNYTLKAKGNSGYKTFWYTYGD